MGQKVSPHGLRVGVIKDWGSKWYAGKNDFADFLIGLSVDSGKHSTGSRKENSFQKSYETGYRQNHESQCKGN